MNKHLAAILALIATALPVTLSAAVPLRWTVETNRIQPAQFEGYHGETIEFAATMQSYGKPLAITNDLIGIYWQTNGMGAAYWTAPAALSNNVMIARFEPSMDVGANVYSCFIGAPGEIYRAAFQLRLRPSPGAVPSELPLPVKTLDYSQIQVLNPPYYTQSETDARIRELASTPGNYETVSNRAMTAVQPSAIADMETQTHAAANYVPFANTTKTAVKIGGLNTAQSTDGGGTVAIGRNTRALADSSFAGGHRAMTATGTKYALSFGNRTYAPTGATALGYQAWASSTGYFANDDSDVVVGLGEKHKYSFVWQGKDDGDPGYYHSHGDGTFNIKPIGGLGGVWIGSQSLASLLNARQPVISDLDTIRTGASLGATAVQPNDLSADNPVFSNAVLAVGLNIDTNSVAVLNDLANTLDEVPIEGATATVGGLLAMLAAAVAWLKKHALKKGMTDGVPDDPNVANFFSEFNTLLTARVNTLINTAVGDVNAVLAAALDGSEVA